MEAVVRIKKQYLDFLVKAKKVINGTYQISEGKPLTPEKVTFDIETERENIANKIVREIVNEIPKEIFTLDPVENHIVFGGTDKGQMTYSKETLDSDISNKLNGLITVAKIDSEPLTTSKKQVLGLLIESGIIHHLQTKYNANNNQIGKFIAVITQNEIQQKTAYNGITNAHKDYSLQNCHDTDDANNLLNSIFKK